jgi:dTDP-4-dehydrorhamnose reductase
MLDKKTLRKIRLALKNNALVVEGANGSMSLSLLKILIENEIKVPRLLLTTKSSIPDKLWNKVSNKIELIHASNNSFLNKRNKIITSFTKSFNVFYGAGYGRPNLFLNDPKSVISANIKNLIEYSNYKNLNLFAYYSTSEIYSGSKGSVNEDSSIVSSTQQPRSVYIETKRLGEAITANIISKVAKRAVSYRIALAISPKIIPADNRVLADLIHSGRTKRCVVLNGGSNLVRQYQYGPNSIYKILGSLVNGDATLYNNAGSHIITLGNLAKLVAKILKVKCKIQNQNVDNTSPKKVLINSDLIDAHSKYQIKKEKNLETYLRLILC